MGGAYKSGAICSVWQIAQAYIRLGQSGEIVHTLMMNIIHLDCIKIILYICDIVLLNTQYVLASNSTLRIGSQRPGIFKVFLFYAFCPLDFLAVRPIVLRYKLNIHLFSAFSPIVPAVDFKGHQHLSEESYLFFS